MLKTKFDRIKKDIEALAAFTSAKGPGCTRFTYSKEFAAARDYIVSEMKAAGLSVREDPVGTVIGRMEGKNPEAPVIMTGSHFDTVKTGGWFDGPAGIAAALETARTLHDEGFLPEVPIEFVALPEEEGARFGAGLFGSRAICGQLKPGEIENNRDQDGISVAEAMKAYGLDPDRAPKAQRLPGEIGTFLELHIEQGPLLENSKIDIGIVESIVGLRVLDVHVYGRSDHAGNTPMHLRADTMLAAARAITAGTEKALELGDSTVLTCGRLETRPGAFNIVAKETFFQLDCRSRTLAAADEVLKTVRAVLDRSCAENPGLTYVIEEKVSSGEVPMAEDVKAVLRECADAAGITHLGMLSGAGHDAMVMGSVCSAAMVFVPSRGGRSHVPEEWTDYEDLQKGVEVVYRAVRKLASLHQ